MSKVHIVTFHWVHNHGAVMQCYALCEAVKEMGHEVELLDYRPYRIYFRQFLSCLLRHRIRRLSVVIPFRNFLKKYLPLSKKIFWKKIKVSDTLAPDARENMDIYISGSDQLWNYKITGGLDFNFLLEFAPPGSKKISYASSMGGVEFPDDVREHVKKGLNDFSAIAAREEFTKNQVEELTGMDVALTLDPVFLRDSYSEIISKKKVPSEDYIVTYCLQDSERFRKVLKILKERHGMPVLNIGPVMPEEADRHIYSLSPGEWLGMIKNADYVVTNSFHGLAFSILFNRQFLCLGMTGGVSSRSDRLSNLCGLLHLEHRLLLDDVGLDSLGMGSDIDYSKVDVLLNEEREKSLAYLRNNLG